MKYIIGIIVTILILCVAAFFTLDLWGIENPVTLEQLQKGLLLLIVIPFFFRNNGKGYDRNGGNVAKPKQK